MLRIQINTSLQLQVVFECLTVWQEQFQPQKLQSKQSSKNHCSHPSTTTTDSNNSINTNNKKKSLQNKWWIIFNLRCCDADLALCSGRPADFQSPSPGEWRARHYNRNIELSAPETLIGERFIRLTVNISKSLLTLEANWKVLPALPLDSWLRTDLANKQSIRMPMFIHFPDVYRFFGEVSCVQSVPCLAFRLTEFCLTELRRPGRSPQPNKWCKFSVCRETSIWGFDVSVKHVKDASNLVIFGMTLCRDVVSVGVSHVASFCFRILERSVFCDILCVSHVEEEAIFRSSSELLVIILQIC